MEEKNKLVELDNELLPNEINEEEVRTKILEEFGFDESKDSEKIDKLVKKEVEHTKKLRSAIGAKIKHRTEFERLQALVGKGADTVQPQKTVKSDNNLSQDDLIAIIRANVHDDDVEKVVKFAKLEEVSVKEALKSPTLKTILATNEEFRKSSELANKGTSKRVTTKVTGEALLNDLSKGIVPKAGSTEAEELFWVIRGGKR